MNVIKLGINQIMSQHILENLLENLESLHRVQYGHLNQLVKESIQIPSHEFPN